MTSESIGRRRLLAAAGAAATALAGCSDALRFRAGNSAPEQVSLTVKTPPPDDDPIAAKIASQHAENLRAAGVDAVPEPVDPPELYREVLLEHDFDLFVTRHPGFDDPDALRALLHSDFAGERGWQNPFGFSDPTVDELLERQATDDDREEPLTELFEYLLATSPYTAIAFPDRLGAANSSLGLSAPPRRPVEFVQLLEHVSSQHDREEPVRAGLFGQVSIDRLNPVAVDVADVEFVCDLLYDPLVRETPRGYVPWLADDVRWDEDGELEATVPLRDDLTWHDGTSITPGDVTFTVAFLEDTADGATESPLPAPRHRGLVTAIDGVSRVGRRAVRFSFDDRSRAVARRALTIPLLPEHVWADRTEPIDESLTEALAWDNEEPVGSGLFTFADASGDRLELQPYDDHVLRRDGVPGYEDLLEGDHGDAGLEFRVSPTATTVVETLLADDVDLVRGSFTPSTLESVADDPGTSTMGTSTRSFYLVGYNTRRPELGNHRFRETVSQLVDRQYVADEFCDGRAEPALTPDALVGVFGDEWRPQRPDVLTFPGTDGEIDVDVVRTRFEEAGGYRYDEDGNLLA